MRIRWETDSRYYDVRLSQDLFNDWVLLVSRGGKRNRLGALRTIFVASKEEGLKKIQELEKVRARRGYVRVPYISAFQHDWVPDQEAEEAATGNNTSKAYSVIKST
jgi:hypothetical protein